MEAKRAGKGVKGSEGKGMKSNGSEGNGTKERRMPDELLCFLTAIWSPRSLESVPSTSITKMSAS